MEELGRVLERSLDLFWRVVGLFEPLVQRLAGAFDVDLGPAGTRFWSAIVVLSLVGFLVRKVFWPGAGWATIKPQTIMQTANKTPLQIVLEDLNSCLLRLVLTVLVILLVVILAAR
jgi:hypothetical protein